MSVDAPEIKIVASRKVSCDGDEGSLGHPRVFLTMDDEGKVECPYCDRLYILQDGPADTSGKAGK